MASSATILDLLISSQAGKELTVNALLDAASPAVLFGRRAFSCGGLTWGYYGGVIVVDGVPTTISNGSLALTANQINYVEAARDGSVSKNTSGFTPGRIPLYTCTTDAYSVSSHADYRAWVQPEHVTSKASVTVTAADYTLTASEARAGYLTISGTLTGNRSVIVPNDWTGMVYNSTSGAFTLTVKTLSGSGLVVGSGKRSILFADGANVVRGTADV